MSAGTEPDVAAETARLADLIDEMAAEDRAAGREALAAHRERTARWLRAPDASPRCPPDGGREGPAQELPADDARAILAAARDQLASKPRINVIEALSRAAQSRRWDSPAERDSAIEAAIRHAGRCVDPAASDTPTAHDALVRWDTAVHREQAHRLGLLDRALAARPVRANLNPPSPDTRRDPRHEESRLPTESQPAPESQQDPQPRRRIGHRLELVPEAHVGWLTGKDAPPRGDPAATATWGAIWADALRIHAEYGESVPIGISVTTEGGTDPAKHGWNSAPGGTAAVTLHVWDAGPGGIDREWEPEATDGHAILAPDDGPRIEVERADLPAHVQQPSAEKADRYFVAYRVDWAEGEDMTAWTDVRAGSSLEAAVKATSRTTPRDPYGTGRDRVPRLRDEPIRVSKYVNGDKQYAGRFSREDVEQARAAERLQSRAATLADLLDELARDGGNGRIAAAIRSDDPFEQMAELAEKLASEHLFKLRPETLPRVARMFEEWAADNRAEGRTEVAARRERLAKNLRELYARRNAQEKPVAEQRRAPAGGPAARDDAGSRPAVGSTPSSRQQLADILLAQADRHRARNKPALAAIQEALAAKIIARDVVPDRDIQQRLPDQPGMLAPAAAARPEHARSR